MNYQWYPGHMTKARRMMQENIKLIDLVIELVDARIPISSRNPDIDELGKGKSRIILLNKSDLADPVWNKKWVEYFSNQGMGVLEINSRTGMGIKSIQGLVQEVCKEKIERDRKRGIVNRPVRAMVVGIPNVGKSTFINTVCGERRAAAEDRPGVTRQNARISVPALGLELTDTPGLLWHKFEDKAVGMKLACLGSINDDIIDQTALCYDLIALISPRYSGSICERYGISIEEGDTAGEIFEKIARRRGFLCRGGVVDDERTARVVLDEFRAGKLGRITLDTE